MSAWLKPAPMADPRFRWDRYDRWNAAVADVVYSTDGAGRPAYLDLEDEVVRTIRDVADPEAADPAKALVEATRSTLELTRGAAAMLTGHEHRLQQWERGDMMTAPPVLALLAVMSLAAENMHQGDGQAAHNFYGRLAELYELNDRQQKWFTDAYRSRRGDGPPLSERFWGAINTWLERVEGNRGLPTAFALAHAHVGLPLSQALVRQTDRERFSVLFEAYGLPPYATLPVADMDDLLAEWLSRTPCPVSNTLHRMWLKEGAARERIVDIARLTLESWDGAEAPAGVPGRRQIDAVRINALLRRFPVRQLEITLVVAARSTAPVEALTLVDRNGALLGELDFVPGASGWLSLADPSDVDAGSFLRGETMLVRGAGQAALRRRPRRVLPLRRDELLQAFVECERLSLGEDALLLATNEVANKVADALALVARPGFSRYDSVRGLPDGWTLFDGVQILSSPPPEVASNQLLDLHVLRPLATSQVVLQGGMRLPGHIRKWSSALPPELRVTSDAAAEPSARLTTIRVFTSDPAVERQQSSTQAVLIWDLAAEHLPDGDYEISVFESGVPMGRPEVLRLRSADTPAVRLEDDAVPLAHDPVSAAFALLTARSDADDAFRCAPLVDTPLAGVAPATSTTPPWFAARRTAAAPSRGGRHLQIPGPDKGSCMLTGAHHMMVETATQGVPSVEGVCKTCGLVKRYPARGRRARRAPKAATCTTAPRVNVLDLTKVKDSSQIDWALAFDSLCHVGAGPISALERIAMQLEPTPLFGDVFARHLEALGHVELERDPPTLAVIAWEVVGPTLAGLADGRAVLVGFRSERLLVAIEDAAWARKIDLTVDHGTGALPRVRLESHDADLISDVARAIEGATGRRVRYVPQAAEALASTLPPFSRAIAALSSTSAVGGRSPERWNAVTARFEPARDAGTPGAYRFTDHGRRYLYRRPEDIGASTAVVGDARIVKHASALAERLPLVGYDADQRVLYVPLGADLPGLYGRAAVLASGRPPHENTFERLLEYRGVSAQLAATLSGLLMS